MKNILIITLLITLLSCENKPHEIQYDGNIVIDQCDGTKYMLVHQIGNLYYIAEEQKNTTNCDSLQIFKIQH